MPKKIRVYELARELGLTNKEALDLSLALGIGVKSHSSSIEDAQADRVRRKADAEGLRREVSPPEPGKGAKTAKKPSSDPVVAGDPEQTEPRSEPVPVGLRVAAEVTPEPGGAPGVPPPMAGRDPRLIVSRPSLAPEPPELRSPAVRPPAASPPVASTPAPVAPEPAQFPSLPPLARAPAERGVPLVRPAPSPPPAPSQAESHPAPPPGAPPSAPVAVPPLRPAKPVPPPPGVAPVSRTGKPIPPPPGLGGRAAPPSRPGVGPGRPGGPPGSGGPRTAGVPRPGGVSPRPGTSGGTGAPGAGVGAGFGGVGRGGPAARPGFGGRPGGPGGGGPGGFGGRPGGPGGPGGRGRPPRRRGGRRRRPLEELEPFDPSQGYTASNEPVPEGEILVERGSTAQDLGPRLNRSSGDVVRFLFLHGEPVTATQPLSDEAIELFAEEIGATVRLVEPGEEKEAALHKKYFENDEEDEDPEMLRARPPVITVMGHVDHGKTLLLDRIRESNVVAGEAGGITQHIGAYQVEKEGRLITFIDTPGHEAFTAMRARGARVTDIVVLVVAADDGVMPQTVEALNHAKAADVPIVVAINKVDRENADPTRVMQQLSEQGLVPEPWGGDTIMVEVSALQNLGVDDLLEQLLVVADVEELTANPEARARGSVLEANLDVGRGPVATMIVEEGTLRVGDPVVAGAAWGRVRAMIDEHGDNIKEAPPSTPMQVLGFSDVPTAGDEFRVTTSDKAAKDIAQQREQRYRLGDLRKTPSVAAGTGARLEDIFEQISRGETATLNVILKADVQGSLEAVTESLRKLERDDVKLSFVHRAVGGITENDVQLAAASNATIIGFNVRPDRKGRTLADSENVEIRAYEIIYKLIEDIQSAMVGMLAAVFEEVVTGDAEVREVFGVPRVGKVAGCMVRNGAITRGSKVRFLREGVVIWNGTITSLRRFKDDAREVASGFECGIGLSDFQDLRAGDVIETYEEREVPRT
ncbi:MAG: translation initiation factor IF-2 [Acidimicrobiales bacterium]